MSFRIGSYTDTNWPHRRPPTKLAAAGFYRLVLGSEEDIVECAFYKAQLYDWDDRGYPIEDLIMDYKGDCLWLELRVDFYDNNYLLLLAPQVQVPRYLL